VPAQSIDEYLASIPEPQRAALERLRRQIRAAVPDAQEAISYGMPAFRVGEGYFVGFGATKDRCSFYVGRAPVVALAEELAGYRLWKGTVNFRPDLPLPDELVRKLIEVRLAERG
jgi:uncharacterized protein YdhG (YjbR/CyaY superfamily)